MTSLANGYCLELQGPLAEPPGIDEAFGLFHGTAAARRMWPVILARRRELWAMKTIAVRLRHQAAWEGENGTYAERHRKRQLRQL